MAIRTVHNYGGPAILAAHGAGVGRARQRQAKYQLDWMREQQKLAARREEMFLGHAMSLDRQNRQQAFTQERDVWMQEQLGARDRIRDERQAERDKFLQDRYDQRAQQDRDFTLGRDRQQLADSTRSRQFAEIENAIREGRYSDSDAMRLREVMRDIEAVRTSNRFTDERDRQAAIDQLMPFLDDYSQRRLPEKKREDRARENTVVWDPDKKDYVEWGTGGPNAFPVPLDENGRPDWRNAQKPEGNDAAAKAQQAREDEIAKRARDIANSDDGPDDYGEAWERAEREVTAEEEARRKYRERQGGAGTEGPGEAPPAGPQYPGEGGSPMAPPDAGEGEVGGPQYPGEGGAPAEAAPIDPARAAIEQHQSELRAKQQEAVLKYSGDGPDSAQRMAELAKLPFMQDEQMQQRFDATMPAGTPYFGPDGKLYRVTR